MKTIQDNWSYCMGGSKGKEVTSSVEYLAVFITLADFDFWGGENEGGRGVLSLCMAVVV